MDMARYFVTNEGLAAAYRDPDVLESVMQVLRGEAPRGLVRELILQHFIDEDRRDVPHVDNTLIVLSGALTRIHQLVEPPTPPPTAEQRRDEEIVQDRRTIPRRLYRLRPNTELTNDQLAKLPSGARQVFVALRRAEVGTTKTLAEATGLARRSVENAVSALRKLDLILDADFHR